MRHRRSYVLFAVAFVIHTLASMTAHGAELETALVTPEVAEDGVTWHARYVLREAEPTVLRFAVPLPRGEEMLPASGVGPIVEDGRIAGVRIDALPTRESGRQRDVHVAFRQKDPHGVLGVPFVEGDAVQILDLVPDGGARVEVDAKAPFVRRVGYVAPDAIGAGARQGARAVTWFGKRSALYARGDDVRAAGGLHGEALTKPQIARRAALPIGGLFVVIVGALIVAFRKVRHAASVERADAILARELDAVEAR
jgi:hypothetical protein